MSQDNYEPEDENFSEERRDELFTRRLDNDLRFEARQDFRYDLRARLLEQLPEPGRERPQNQTRLKRPLFNLPAFRPWQMATIGAMLFVIAFTAGVLVFSLSGENGDNEAALTISATASPSDRVTTLYYDDSTGKNLDATTATRTLGFNPAQPVYLPAGYSSDSATIYRDQTEDTPRAARPGMRQMAPTLKLKYAYKATTPGSTPFLLEVYQSQLVTNQPQEPRYRMMGQMAFNMMGNRLNKYREQIVQGANGYLIEDQNWQLGFGTNARNLPDEAGTRPAGATGQGLVNFYNQGRGGFPPGGLLEFRATDAKTPLKSLVWNREGVVLVLVSSDSLPTAELVKIAESIK